jgi:hypothetical protein
MAGQRFVDYRGGLSVPKPLLRKTIKQRLLHRLVPPTSHLAPQHPRLITTLLLAQSLPPTHFPRRNSQTPLLPPQAAKFLYTFSQWPTRNTPTRMSRNTTLRKTCSLWYTTRSTTPQASSTSTRTLDPHRRSAIFPTGSHTMFRNIPANSPAV